MKPPNQRAENGTGDDRRDLEDRLHDRKRDERAAADSPTHPIATPTALWSEAPRLSVYAMPIIAAVAIGVGISSYGIRLPHPAAQAVGFVAHDRTD